MLFHTLRLSGLLSFGPDGIDLPMKPLNVLIGPNGSGKSNLLEAVSLLQAAPRGISEPISRTGGVREWTWKGADASDSITMDVMVSFPPGPASRPPSAVFQRRGYRSDESLLSFFASPNYPALWHLKEQYRRIRLYRNWSLGPDAGLRRPCSAHARSDFLDEGAENLPLVLSQLQGAYRTTRRRAASRGPTCRRRCRTTARRWCWTRTACEWNTAEFFRTASPETVVACLGQGADVEPQDAAAMTPLHRAAGVKAPPAVIKALLAVGADPNARDGSDSTPLHAAATGPAELVDALLARGADPEGLTEDGRTPLHTAALSSAVPSTIRVPIASGANPHARMQAGWTPLHLAARFNERPEIVKALLDGYADPMVRDDHGRLPADLAAENSALNGTGVLEWLDSGNEGR